MQPQVSRVTFNGSTWTYRYAGSGPPVVWLHGLWGEPGWEPHHQRLAERHTVYAPALAGYDGSTAPDWLSDMEDMATLMVEFLDALGLERVDVAGHSLGGWAAAEVAVFRPSRLRRLVLIDPLGLCLDWTEVPNIFYNDPAALPGIFFADPSYPAARRYVPPPAEWDDRFILNRMASIRVTFEPYLHSRKLGERLRFADVPTLVVWGADDGLLHPRHAREWQTRMPNCEVTLVESAGHFPHVERADVCLPRIMTFLEPAGLAAGVR